jgi:hypothetical protein
MITKQWKLSIFRVSAEDKSYWKSTAEKYNQYRSDLHSKWCVSKENNDYIELMLRRESE